MRKLTFKCAITCGLTPFIDLQQKSVEPHQNGSIWSGSLAVDVDETLNIAITVTGINGSPWTVEIMIGCPGGCLARSRFGVCGPIVCTTKERLRDSTGTSALAAQSK